MTDESAIYDLLRRALVNLDSIAATYEGHARLFSPHILGTKNGDRRVFAYQWGGTSLRGLAPAGSPLNWRCISIRGLTDVRIVPGTWRSPSEFGSHHGKCIDQVDIIARFSPDRDQCELDEAA